LPGFFGSLILPRPWVGLLGIVGEFFLLVGIWCYVAYKLTQTKANADLLTNYGNNLIPFVLIGLGVLILVDSQTLLDPTLTVIALLVSSFALMSLSKNLEANS
jgi:cadmium resistance protein CadD (predicted permease)